ncbi:MAG: putative glycolipid-binding domain-containing protein [Chitinophagaceae bacterium]|nr:putative glycolipid-binding domain-containing protein [Chitinophagaceae bacterium]
MRLPTFEIIGCPGAIAIYKYTMETNLLWKAKEYPSLENCVHTIDATGSETRSVIVGMMENKIFKVEYLIKTNAFWQTKYIEIKSRLADFNQSFSFHSDGKGNWKKNGLTVREWHGCIDVDLPLTPFTNTLPVNRLGLAKGETQQIKVVYLDLLNQQIKPVVQKYTRISKNEYRYENVPNDFEAAIRVDEVGLVISYPGLFERVASTGSPI